MKKNSLLLAMILVCGCEIQNDDAWIKGRFEASYVQVDRIGLPFLDELFVNDSEVLAGISSGDPVGDESDLRPIMEAGIERLRSPLDRLAGLEDADFASLDDALDALIPNVLSIDLNSVISTRCDNGYDVETDDGLDYMSALILGRSSLVDEFRTDYVPNRSFPYLLKPLREADIEASESLSDEEKEADTFKVRECESLI